MPGQIEFSFKSANVQPRPAVKRTPNTAMRILMLGDLGGKSNSGLSVNDNSAADWSIIRIDIDNFAAVMSRIAPKLQLQLGNDTSPAIPIIFRQMEDFHPDTLFQKLEIFQGLSQIRDRLRNPATFAEAAEELRNSIQFSLATPVQEQTHAAVKPTIEDDAATFDRLLGARSRDREESSRISTETVASNYIKNIVAEYIIPDAPPFKDIYIKAVDDTISAKMRELLHHPDFQALEAAWRSLNMLVTSLETGENLSLHLLDVTKEALFTDLSSAGENLQASRFYSLLVEQGVDTFGGEPWSLMVGNYTFSASAEDVNLLAALGVVASHVGGPFLAAVDPNVLGCRSLIDSPDSHDWLGMEQEVAQRWQALRHSSAALWLGLALPRLLMRMPYGRDTEPVERFEFEEILPAQVQHQAFLWGNPAFYCALLIARSFSERGWSMQLGDYLEIDDLPAYIIEEHGESALQPCAEVCLSDKAMEKILDQGIMSFISHRRSNIVRLARFQSVAEPLKALAGPWNL